MTTKVSMEMLAPDVVGAILGAKKILGITRVAEGTTFSGSNTGDYANANNAGHFTPTTPTSNLLVIADGYFDSQRASNTTSSLAVLACYDGTVYNNVAQARPAYMHAAGSTAVRLRLPVTAIAILTASHKHSNGTWSNIRWRALAATSSDTWTMYNAQFLLIEFEP